VPFRTWPVQADSVQCTDPPLPAPRLPACPPALLFPGPQALQYRLRVDLKASGGDPAAQAFDQLRDARGLEYELDRVANRAARDKQVGAWWGSVRAVVGVRTWCGVVWCGVVYVLDRVANWVTSRWVVGGVLWAGPGWRGG